MSLARLRELAAQHIKPAVTIALMLAAASTGVVIPVLRAFIEETGHGRRAGGVFTAAHVLGGVVGAVVGARALRRAGSARRLAAVALTASIAVTLAMASVISLELRIALRFVDGGCHLLAITAIVAAATAGDVDQRSRRAVVVGVAIVIGIVVGLGIGAAIGRPQVAGAIAGIGLGALGSPEIALVIAALLSGAALITVLTRVAGEPLPARPATSRDRLPVAPGLLAFCERFSFGSMTAAMPFLATPGRIGLIVGLFMTASLAGLAAAWRYAPAWGPRRLAVRSALGFTVALGISIAIDAVTSPSAAVILTSRIVAVLWAIAAGTAAGSLYASALVLATRSAEIEARARGMAAVHASGSAGHALGALTAGTLAFALPGMLVITVPSIAVIATAAIGVWITVPEAARDCPVIGGLEASQSAPSQGDQPVT